MAELTDLLTLAEAQAAIGAPGDQSYDDQLERAITAVTALIETRVGPVVQRTVTDELHDGCKGSIWPVHRPVISVTSVVEAWGTSTQTLSAETWATAASNAYLFDPVLGRIQRRDGGYGGWFASRVKITYEAGRYADTESVDPRFKEAAAIALAHNWGLDHGSGNSTFGGFDGTDGVPAGRGYALPNRALEILADDRRVPGIA